MTVAHDSDFVKLCLEIPHDIEHVPEVIEKLENIRIALVKSGDREAKFVFETMDVDQARLFSTLRLGDVLEGANL